MKIIKKNQKIGKTLKIISIITFFIKYHTPMAREKTKQIINSLSNTCFKPIISINKKLLLLQLNLQINNRFKA